MKQYNKGFSLVELIVVVLIMAIVAVALAPQVVKWVNNSKISTDVQTRNTIKEQCEIALADPEAFDEVKNGGYTITITKTDSGTTYVYTDEAGTPITPNPSTDKYWANLFNVSGVSDHIEFNNLFKIKSKPENGSIVLKVVIYDQGFTRASLTGISGNDDIEVVSDIIPEDA